MSEKPDIVDRPATIDRASVGTPVLTADGAIIHPGATLYWLLDTSTGKFTVKSGRVLSLSCIICEMDLPLTKESVYASYLYADIHNCVDSAVKQGTP